MGTCVALSIESHNELWSVYAMNDYLWKKRISIYNEAPMDERNAKKVAQHVKRQNTSW